MTPGRDGGGAPSGADAADSRPQLQIWDDEERESGLGTVEQSGTEWAVAIVLERVSADLVKGRIAFRADGERLQTAPVIVEESPEAVLRRAREMPASMLRQLLLSVRG